MKSNPSIKEQVQEKLKAVNREGYERRSGVAGGFPVMSVDQATEAILKIIESEVTTARINELGRAEPHMLKQLGESHYFKERMKDLT